MESPGFEKEKMRMDPDDLKDLSDAELKSQVDREAYLDEKWINAAVDEKVDLNKVPLKMQDGIRVDAAAENLRREQAELRIKVTREKDASLIEEAQKKVKQAFDLLQESKK